MTAPHEIQAIIAAAQGAESHKRAHDKFVAERDDAIVTAHANHAIPMADIYTASRLSPGMVHRILTRAGAPHRPRGGRPAKTDGGAA